LHLLDPSSRRGPFLALVLTSLGTLAVVLLVDRAPLGSAGLKGGLSVAALLALSALGARWFARGLERPLRRLARDLRAGQEPRVRRTDGAALLELGAALRGVLGDSREPVGEHEDLARRVQELLAENETLRSSVEQVGAAAHRKAQLLANLSHEIRTPMNGILGMNEFLLDSPLSAQQRAWSQTVRSSAESLLGILDDILDYAHIEGGRMRLESIEFDLHRMLHETLQLLDGLARDKGLDLALEIGETVPRNVVGDPLRLRQVLTNLIGNALKFTREGHVGVRVRRDDLDADRVTLRFEIADTGIGIAEGHRADLFRPFSQVDSSSTRRFGGTGLGLSVAQSLVTLMGGEMGVESQLGIGSTFWFTAVLAAGREGFRVILVPEGRQRPRVLVAERSAAAREQLHQLLGVWGFEHELVADAPRARSALQRAGTEPFGLCLVDEALLEDPLLVGALRSTSPAVVRLAQVGGEGPTPFPTAPAIVRPVRPSALYDALVEVLGAGDERGETLSAVERGSPSVGSSDLRILLAEDNVVNQVVAVRALEREGYACDVATNGRQTVDAVCSGRYDVVLMDCQMPEIDGFQATREIRRWERETGAPRPVRIVALTANALAGDRERCLRAGMDDYLSKPVRPQLLRELLMRIEEECKGPDRPAGEQVSGAPEAGAGLEALLQRQASRPEALGLLVDDLERRSRTVIGRLRRALGAQATEELAAGARELGESLAVLSTQRLLELAGRLEERIAARALEPVAELLGEIEAELARTRAELPALLSSRRTSAARATGEGPAPRSRDNPRAG
jgi:two-component system sensor histidine kinase/response regulator